MLGFAALTPTYEIGAELGPSLTSDSPHVGVRCAHPNLRRLLWDG